MQGSGGGGSVLARRNGEGDVSSISSDVVRKLWPSILQVCFVVRVYMCEF